MLLYNSAVSGNCYKVRLLAAHLGLPLELEELSVVDRSNRAEVLGDLNPARRVPTLVLDDGRPLAESNAILWYLGDEERPCFQVLVHDRERGAAFREPLGQLGAASVVGRQVLDDVARRRNERLVAVLLEKHPLQRLCATKPIARHKRRTLGEVPEDRVRLGEMRTVVELERRDATVQVSFQELRRPRRAGVDVELRPVVAQTELREH